MSKRSEKIKHFSKWLEKGEVVTHVEYEKKLNLLSQFSILLALSISGILLIITETTMSIFGFFLMAVAVLLFLEIFFYFIFNKGFVITSRKIIILNNKRKAEIYPYDEIFSIDVRNIKDGIDTIKIKIRRKENFKKSTVHIPTDLPASQIQSKIQAIWKDKSPYHLFNIIILSFAKKHKFSTRIFKHFEKTPLEIKSKKKNPLQFHAVIKEVNNINYLKVQMKCSNEHHLYFRMKAEKDIHTIGKLLGVQDIEIGHSIFDEAILLQGNDKEDIMDILDETLMAQIQQYIPLTDGTIEFGEYQKEEETKGKSIREQGTLDEHLTVTPYTKEREIGKKDSLTLQCRSFNHTQDYSQLAHDIIAIMEMMLKIAKNIEKTSKK